MTRLLSPLAASSKRTWVLRCLATAVLLDAALLQWVGLTGGGRIELGPIPFSITSSKGPLTLFFAGLAIHAWLSGKLGAALLAVRETFRHASLGRRLALLLLAAAALPALQPYLRLPPALKPELLELGGIRTNQANAHVEDLVYQVVSRTSSAPPVVYIEDDDARGHFASYYCYPRAIRMEPALRRWSLVARVINYWESVWDDPGFSPDPRRPTLESSREYARRLGADLLIAPASLGGYGELWSLAYSAPEEPSFFESDDLAGLLDAEPSSAAQWLDFDHDGRPDLTLEHWRTGERTVYRNLGLLFDRSGSQSAAEDCDGERIDLPASPQAALSALQSALEARGPTSLARMWPEFGLGDLDGDGDLDVLVCRSESEGGARLLLDRGDGVLVDRTAGSGLDRTGGACACALGDFDGDGELDVYLCRPEGNRLLHNLGGQFEDVTLQCGLQALDGRTAATFADFDNDGLADLYVTCAALAGVRTRPNLLLHNQGNGTFVALSAESRADGNRKGEHSRAALCDFDRDGFLDIALAAGLDPAFLGAPTLLKNRGGSGLSARVTWSSGSPAQTVVALRSVTARRVVLSRPLSELAGRNGSEPGAHLGLGKAGFARFVQLVRRDRSVVCLQSAPAASTVALDAGVAEATFIRSHPAALLGEVPAFDLEASEARALELGAPPGSPDEREIARRAEELLAYAFARHVADEVKISDSEVAQAFQRGRRLSVMPERLLIEHVAIDAKRVPAVEPAGGDDVLASEWKRVADPSAALGIDEAGFFAVRRWMSAAALQQEFGEPVERLFALEDEVTSAPKLTDRYGRVRETIDSRGGLGLVPVAMSRAGLPGWVSTLRLVQVERGGIVQRAWIEADLRRAIAFDRLRSEFAVAPPLGAGSPTGYLGHVPYQVAELATAARERGFEGEARVQAALTRIRREVALDQSLRSLASSFEPARSAVDELSRAQPAADSALASDLARAELRMQFTIGLLDRVLVWESR